MIRVYEPALPASRSRDPHLVSAAREGFGIIDEMDVRSVVRMGLARWIGGLLVLLDVDWTGLNC